MAEESDMRLHGRDPRGWEPTPKWHWRYWFGYRMRLYDSPGFAHYDPGWEYRTFGQHARAVLKERAGG